MTAQRPAVKVVIGGEEYTVRSELPPEYTREVAAHFDRILGGIRASLPTVEAHKVAILAGLAVTDELFQARRGDADVATRLAVLVEDIARCAAAGATGRSGVRHLTSRGPGRVGRYRHARVRPAMALTKEDPSKSVMETVRLKKPKKNKQQLLFPEFGYTQMTKKRPRNSWTLPLKSSRKRLKEAIRC